MIWGSRSQLARCEFHCHRLRPRCRCETFWGGTGAVLDTHAVQVPSGKRTKKRTGKSPSLIFKFGKSTTNEVFSIVLLNYQRVPGRLGSCAHCDLGLLTNRVLRGSTPKDYLDAIGRSSSRPIFCRFHVVFFLVGVPKKRWQGTISISLYIYIYMRHPYFTFTKRDMQQAQKMSIDDWIDDILCVCHINVWYFNGRDPTLMPWKLMSSRYVQRSVWSCFPFFWKPCFILRWIG